MLPILGAAGFGTILGWYLYYINRYRAGAISLGDLATVVGVLGGGAVVSLFPAKSDLFGAYGIGLFVGFFGYFVVLVVLISLSKRYGIDWFIDGTDKSGQRSGLPQRAMGQPESDPAGVRMPGE